MLGLGAERDEVAVVADQRGAPTYAGHLAAAVRELLELRRGRWHTDHDRGARSPRAQARVLGAAERATGGADAAPLA